MHRNLYWIYPKAIPHRLCDDIIKFGLSQPNEMGITGQKLPSEITNKDIKIIKKKRRSQVTWLNDWHCDGFNDSFSSGELKGLTRKISLTLTLSDPKEYEGGDLQFKLRNTEKDKITFIKETREKGTLVFFPSFVWHRVTPVTSGTRYSLVLWSAGKPFI
jgi:hypothetical protein